MAHRTPYPTCIFCGAKANSREHAIPKWMSKRLGIKVIMRVSSGGFVTPRKQPVSFASHRARIFCRDCNTHFKHLEDSVIPLIVPMASRGRVLALGRESQRTLALWVAKTAMALIAAGSPELHDLVPQSHRVTVRTAGRAPADSWIGFYAWDGTPQVFFGDHILGERGVDLAAGDQTYAVVFTFAGLGFKMIGFIDPMRPDYAIDTPSRSIVQFWPPLIHQVAWPALAPALTFVDFPLLIEFAPIRKT